MGIERSRQLIALRRADVHGSGRIEGPVESADRWERILESMIAAGAPFEERQLAVTGADIAGYLGIPPSPRIGYIKAGLLRHCAKRPEDNNKTALLRLTMTATVPCFLSGNSGRRDENHALLPYIHLQYPWEKCKIG